MTFYYNTILLVNIKNNSSTIINMMVETKSYLYVGEVLNNLPHGKGLFKFVNDSYYEGECKYGKPDGYGVYVDKTIKYVGFFSCGKFDGLGSFYTAYYACKGTWRRSKKYGIFNTTYFNDKSYVELWKDDQLESYSDILYVDPSHLHTTKENPHKPKLSERAKPFNLQYIKCITCDNYASATNGSCGHVIMCYSCLIKCKTCPVCRTTIDKCIKLYIS